MIGVFDSGHGGLTVLRALVDELPDRRFFYFGDHARAPYGNRPAEDIHRLTQAAVEQLFALGCRLVVLACNTAAANSLRRLQQEWLPSAHADRRILGVLVPMVEAITGQAWTAQASSRRRVAAPRTVAVFATRGTVASNAYPVEIGKRAPEVTVVQQAAPQLVDLIEAGADKDLIRTAVHAYVGQLMDQLDGRPPDVVMLACTHYPLVADIFAEALPTGVEVLSQPRLVAGSLALYLRRHPEFDGIAGGPGVCFYTSGDAGRASCLGSAFFGRPVAFEAVGGTHRAKCGQRPASPMRIR
jgi:glutamate racemase